MDFKDSLAFLSRIHTFVLSYCKMELRKQYDHFLYSSVWGVYWDYDRQELSFSSQVRAVMAINEAEIKLADSKRTGVACSPLTLFSSIRLNQRSIEACRNL